MVNWRQWKEREGERKCLNYLIYSIKCNGTHFQINGRGFNQAEQTYCFFGVFQNWSAMSSPKALIACRLTGQKHRREIFTIFQGLRGGKKGKEPSAFPYCTQWKGIKLKQLSNFFFPFRELYSFPYLSLRCPLTHFPSQMFGLLSPLR